MKDRIHARRMSYEPKVFIRCLYVDVGIYVGKSGRNVSLDERRVLSWLRRTLRLAHDKLEQTPKRRKR